MILEKSANATIIINDPAKISTNFWLFDGAKEWESHGRIV